MRKIHVVVFLGLLAVVVLCASGDNITLSRLGTGFGVDYLSWHDGIDAMLKPTPDAPLPNVLIHTARIVNAPPGVCQAGMILINPDNKPTPDFFGFVTEDPVIGKYYGPRIFKGTPFENAPVVKAKITSVVEYPDRVYTKIKTEKHVIELELTQFEPAKFCDRPANPFAFHQYVVEAQAKKAIFKFDGKVIPGELPSSGIAGGPAACYAPTGLYIVEGK